MGQNQSTPWTNWEEKFNDTLESNRHQEDLWTQDYWDEEEKNRHQEQEWAHGREEEKERNRHKEDGWRRDIELEKSRNAREAIAGHRENRQLELKLNHEYRSTCESNRSREKDCDSISAARLQQYKIDSKTSVKNLKYKLMAQVASYDAQTNRGLGMMDHGMKPPKWFFAEPPAAIGNSSRRIRRKPKKSSDGNSSDSDSSDSDFDVSKFRSLTLK